MIWRHLACLSYFALLFWILIWNAWIDPPYPAALLLLMLLTPLALALRGILYAQPYSHAWLTLLTPFYFSLGIGNAYANATARLYGCGLMLLSLILFISAIAFVRTKRQKGRRTDRPLS
jgi:uncharacterized membrane protein